MRAEVKGSKWLKKGLPDPLTCNKSETGQARAPSACGCGRPGAGVHLAWGQDQAWRLRGLQPAGAWRTKGTGDALAKWQGQRGNLGATCLAEKEKSFTTLDHFLGPAPQLPFHCASKTRGEMCYSVKFFRTFPKKAD